MVIKNKETRKRVGKEKKKEDYYNLDIIIPKGNRKFPYAEFYSNFLGPLRLVHKRPELASLVQRVGRVNIDEDVSIRWPVFRKIVRWVSSFGSIGGKFSNFYQRLMVSPFTALLNMGRYKTFILAALNERDALKNSSHSDLSSNWTAIVIKDLYKRLNHFKFEGINQRWTEYHAHLDLANIVSAGDGDADCTISLTAEVLEKLRDGEINPMMAVMGGQIKISGDMGLAMKVQSLMG